MSRGFPGAAADQIPLDGCRLALQASIPVEPFPTPITAPQVSCRQRTVHDYTPQISSLHRVNNSTPCPMACWTDRCGSLRIVF